MVYSYWLQNHAVARIQRKYRQGSERLASLACAVLPLLCVLSQSLSQSSFLLSPHSQPWPDRTQLQGWETLLQESGSGFTSPCSSMSLCSEMHSGEPRGREDRRFYTPVQHQPDTPYPPPPFIEPPPTKRLKNHPMIQIHYLLHLQGLGVYHGSQLNYFDKIMCHRLKKVETTDLYITPGSYRDIHHRVTCPWI